MNKRSLLQMLIGVFSAIPIIGLTKTATPRLQDSSNPLPYPYFNQRVGQQKPSTLPYLEETEDRYYRIGIFCTKNGKEYAVGMRLRKDSSPEELVEKLDKLARWFRQIPYG